MREGTTSRVMAVDRLYGELWFLQRQSGIFWIHPRTASYAYRYAGIQYATRRNVTASITDGITEIFHGHTLQAALWPWDSSCNTNEYQGCILGVRAAVA
jgi:hypothetical protein